MKNIFVDYLFAKHILVVQNSAATANAFETLYALEHYFRIRVSAGAQFAERTMIEAARRCLGYEVPEPFYRGFPDSVRELTGDMLAFDQMVHYCKTYGFGMFEEPGHSILEKLPPTVPFMEDTEPVDFVILSNDEAVDVLAGEVAALLKSSRPLSQDAYALVQEYITDYRFVPEEITSKNTAFKLLYDLKEEAFADYLKLSDVIKLADEINHRFYRNRSVHQLNLKNADRKLITAVINRLMDSSHCDIRTCYEKKDAWCGLLHHIHYKPVNEIAAKFTACMRGKGNQSVYSAFERAMAERDIREAVRILKEGKGSTAVLRNLDYLLSRANTREEISFVAEQIGSSNGVVLLQLLTHYCTVLTPGEQRTFVFTKYGVMKKHEETKQEAAHRKTILPDDVRKELCNILSEKIKEHFSGIAGKVYVEPGMEKIALPLSESASFSGFGVLPAGSRIAIPRSRFVRAFTYWEKVNDIDLSCFLIFYDGSVQEISWRTLPKLNMLRPGIVFSGDQTAGYNGGSEYFDIDIERIKKHSKAEYIVFCNNVYSGSTFASCFCRAGFMLRSKLSSGEVYEPKTVATAFTVNCPSRMAYLFAIDLINSEIIWLNKAPNSNAAIAGLSSVSFLKRYFSLTDIMNLGDFFKMAATEVVSTPEEADLVISDRTDLSIREDAAQIHSYDFAAITEWLNR